MARILVAEDDPKQSALIRLYLERDGHSVHSVGDGRAAVDRARALSPDLLVLDVMMPEVDGLDVCRILRADSDVPILLLTARSAESDLLLGLDLGADDYMTKPYSPRELTARIRSLLRRAGAGGTTAPAGSELITAGDLTIDRIRYEVRLGDVPVALTAKEFGILSALAAEPQRVFTRPEIIDRAFGFDRDVLERTVDAHVTNLRRKLAAAADDPSLVLPETVYGRGYRLGAVDLRAESLRAENP